MTFKAVWKKHKLKFIRPARTSRGEMVEHIVYYVHLKNRINEGWGEAAPLPGLSIDNLNEIENKLALLCEMLNEGLPFDALDFEGFPAVKFAFESAFLMLHQDAPFMLFNTPFYRQNAGVPINGLVWMDTKEHMLDEAFEKFKKGFNCLKFKIGALDFDEECRMLESVRKIGNAFKLEIRLDANGAFNNDEALQQLKELSRFEIHSVEQPIKQGQWDMMQEICATSAIPIALDEELIGINDALQIDSLLKNISPQFIILKPTLIGGFKNCNTWIHAAQKQEINWWATSALESNIGLNAIAQWCSSYETNMPQGLGTGSLYHNNIPSPLKVFEGKITYQSNLSWNLDEILAT